MAILFRSGVFVALQAVVVCGVACSSSSSSNNAVMGTVGGESVSVVDQVAFATGSPIGSETQINLTNYAGACAVAQQGDQEGSSVIKIHMVGFPPPLGANPISDTVDAEYKTFDATCNTAAKSEATAGTITVTVASENEVSGTFDLTFADGHLTGSFDAPTCTVANGTLACVAGASDTGPSGGSSGSGSSATSMNVCPGGPGRCSDGDSSMCSCGESCIQQVVCDGCEYECAKGCATDEDCTGYFSSDENGAVPMQLTCVGGSGTSPTKYCGI
jgi:hypothetical protein